MKLGDISACGPRQDCAEWKFWVSWLSQGSLRGMCFFPEMSFHKQCCGIALFVLVKLKFEFVMEFSDSSWCLWLRWALILGSKQGQGGAGEAPSPALPPSFLHLTSASRVFRVSALVLETPWQVEHQPDVLGTVCPPFSCLRVIRFSQHHLQTTFPFPVSCNNLFSAHYLPLYDCQLVRGHD